MNVKFFQMLKKELGDKYNPVNLFLEICNYEFWFQSKESSDTTRKSYKEDFVDLSERPPLQSDEEVKEEKGLNILSLNKLLTRPPILLAQLKAENNSSKLKDKTRYMLYFLCQQYKITKRFATI